MINDDGVLTCCNPKFKNCPEVHPRVDGVDGYTIVGDDGQMVEFTREQFAVLVTEGRKLLARDKRGG